MWHALRGPAEPIKSRRLSFALGFLTFVESFGTVLLERGLYFYTHDVFHFSQRLNLLLALSHGVAYACGAFASHRLSTRFGERRVLAATLFALLGMHVLAGWFGTELLVSVLYPVIGLAHGVKWPVVESFVSAGHSREATLSVLGRFNVTWAVAVPLAVAASGPLIASAQPKLLFWLAALLNVVAAAACIGIPARPRHAPATPVSEADTRTLVRYRALLHSARWSMLGSYALLFLLAPLMPDVFARLGLRVQQATLAACLLDALRAVAFAVLWRFNGWRGRGWPLALCIVAMPVGFLLATFGANLGTVVIGEVLFGAAAGLCYYAALYYALVLGSASVEAGGAHEALIGVGFAVGPLSGLIGHALGAAGLGASAGLLWAIAPMLVICAVCAARPLRIATG